MKKWDELPIAMQNEKVRYYYDILQKHETELKIKRLVDVVCSFVMIVILSPILVLLSIMIKLDSKGPVLFKQVRVTTYGRKFKIWKFRTMVNHADKLGTQVTTKGDARITRMGHLLRKVRLDELPQLFNVLKGDMSVVGPRPMLKEFVELYSPEQARRLEVKPGMTGLAQVSGRNELDYEQRFECDVWYVDHHNIWVDFKIMLKTVSVMLKREGINAPGHVGPSLFTGNNPSNDEKKANTTQ